MKKLILMTAILSATAAHAEKVNCTAEVIETLIKVQTAALNLNSVDKAKYTVEMYGDLINGTDLAKDAKTLCAKAYIKAVPISGQKSQ